MSTPVHYWPVLRRDPWQPNCDRCGVELSRPFYWTKRKTPYRTVCVACAGKRAFIKAIARAMYGPDEKDPRYE